MLIGAIDALGKIWAEELVLAGALLVHPLVDDRTGPVGADEGVPGCCGDSARGWVGEEHLGEDVGVTGQVVADELVPPHIALLMGGTGEDRRPAGSGISGWSHPHGDDRALGVLVASHQTREGGGQTMGCLVDGQGVVDSRYRMLGNGLTLPHAPHESRVSGVIGLGESRIAWQCLGQCHVKAHPVDAHEKEFHHWLTLNVTIWKGRRVSSTPWQVLAGSCWVGSLTGSSSRSTSLIQPS